MPQSLPMDLLVQVYKVIHLCLIIENPLNGSRKLSNDVTPSGVSVYSHMINLSPIQMQWSANS